MGLLRQKAGAVLVAVPLLMACGDALAQCQVKHGPVRNYLKAHPAYLLVDTGDLGPSDRLAWRRAHREQCPGMATVDLAGTGSKSYALAIITKARGAKQERLVLLQAEGKKLLPKTLVSAFAVGDPLVVWRGKARTVREFGSRRRITIAHDAIVFEKLGLSSKVFHLADGKIQTVLVAN